MCNSVFFNTKPPVNPWMPPSMASSQTNLYFLCPFGQVETVIEFGIAKN